MEQSLRTLLSPEAKPTESALNSAFAKLTSSSGSKFSPDLLILLAERYLDSPQPYQKSVVENAEKILNIYNRLQEPLNQFQIRGYICQSLINCHKASRERGETSRELTLKSLELVARALKAIQANSLYKPLAIRAIFVLYRISFPFFPVEDRYHLQSAYALAVQLLEPHLTTEFDSILKLYISIVTLYGCILDDVGKSEEAVKLMTKLFTYINGEHLQLRYSLLHILAHFSRKSPSNVMKLRLEVNEQIQRAIVLYQASRSNQQPNSKDIPEAMKILSQFFENKNDYNEDSVAGEILYGEIGRFASQNGNIQLAVECQQKAQNARSNIARIHASIIGAELNLNKRMEPDARAAIVSNMVHIMSLAQFQGDIASVQDAAAMMWSHCLLLLDESSLIKKPIAQALEVLQKCDAQVNQMRVQMHFTLADIFFKDGEVIKCVDNLKKALSLDYYVPDHPTKLIHPFDRFLVPESSMLFVTLDSQGQQANLIDTAFQYICQPNQVTSEHLTKCHELLLEILPILTSEDCPADVAAHHCSVWSSLIKVAEMIGEYQFSVDVCNEFLDIKFNHVIYDTAIEIQCMSTIPAIESLFRIPDFDIQIAFNFVDFVVQQARQLKTGKYLLHGSGTVYNMIFNKQNPDDASFLATLCGKKEKVKSDIGKHETDSGVSCANSIICLRKSRFVYNAIAAIWNSYFVLQDPTGCVEYVDFFSEIVNVMFEFIDFQPIKYFIGEICNFFVGILLYTCQDNSSSQHTTLSLNQSGRRRGTGVDSVRAKNLKLAEDTVAKVLPVLHSVSEKKALVDKMVEMYGKKNALTPNQADPDMSILVTLSSLTGDKIQHKAETLSGLLSNTTDPIISALISEKAMKLDVYQIAIEAATKTIECIINPSNKDEYYHLALARFSRGVTYLRMIQPKFQEYSCQDKLRKDAAIDLLNSASLFFDTPSIQNSKQALDYFVTTVSSGEEYPKFRVMIVPILEESIEISKKIKIGDDVCTRLYSIYLRGLIDLKEWQKAKRVMQKAISTLEKTYHSYLWELNLIITNNLDSGKGKSPIVDEMLRVKQLGDEKYQSRLWTLVCDLSKDQNIQVLALQKALDVLPLTMPLERVNASANLIRWMYNNDVVLEDIETVLEIAEESMSYLQPEEVLYNRIYIASLELQFCKDYDRFFVIVKKTLELVDELWDATIRSNATPEDDELIDSKKRRLTRPIHKSNSLRESMEMFVAQPTSVQQYLTQIHNVDSHKHVEYPNPPKFIESLLTIIDILSALGHEYKMLKLWYQIFAQVRRIESPRYVDVVELKFRLFIDRLNAKCSPPFPTEFSITEDEQAIWSEIVGRYQCDPISDYPPLRKLLIREAEVELEFGEYKQALSLIRTANKMSKELDDNQTLSICYAMEALVEAVSGQYQNAIELLHEAAKIKDKNSLAFWFQWYKSSIHIVSERGFAAAQVDAFSRFIASNVEQIADFIAVYDVYRVASQFMTSDECAVFLRDSFPKSVLLPSFLPSIDLYTTMLWKALESEFFPRDIVHYREIGNDILKLISYTEDMYQENSSGDEDSPNSFLYRYVDSINLFGKLVVKYNPMIRMVESGECGYDIFGSHASLVAEFVDKTQEPLQHLSAAAAVMKFHAIQHIKGIPKKQYTIMTMLLGQCLHIVARDTVTLQNSVKYLIEAGKLLLEQGSFDSAGAIALELYDLLKGNDTSGAIHQFLISQSASAVVVRERLLYNEGNQTNREFIFVRELNRLRSRFNVPESSLMFANAKKYFSIVENGMHIVMINNTWEEMKQFLIQQKLTVIVIENYRNQTEVTIISLVDKEHISSTPIHIDIDEITMRYEIFKQIIAAPKESREHDAVPVKQVVNKSEKLKKSPIKKSLKLPKGISPEKLTETANVNFAREAMKSNNPEFNKFIEELDEEFSVLKEHFPENDREQAIVLSSDTKVHEIPFECLSTFAKYQVIYRDFSLSSSMNRKTLSTLAPTFGNVN